MASERIGYARVSTKAQKLVHQVEILERNGCDRVYQEKASGKDMNRKELAELLEYLRTGDTLVVTSLERLGRTLMGVLPLIEELHNKGIKLESLSQPIDWESATGRLLVRILMALAEFERELMREKVVKSLDIAASKGIKGGRREGDRKANVDEVANRYKQVRKELKTHIRTCKKVAEEFGLHHATVGRYAEEKGYHVKQKRSAK